jgi:predicted AAA+ superfamily ATPase
MTLYNYIDALSDVFFIFTIRKYSGSYKEHEQSFPKIYVIDNGILTSNGITDNGRLLENLVFLELKRRGEEVCYYTSADNKEVDFVLLSKKKVKALVQVAYSLDDYTVKEREINSLLKASKDLGCNNLFIITWSKEGKEKISSKTIKYIPLWKWLLSNSLREL